MIKPVSLPAAKKIFKSVFPKKNIRISSISLNTAGYTNISYCVTCDGIKYQMKFARPGALKNIAAKVHFNNIMGYGKYDYVNLKSGITIRKWIDGKTLSGWGIRSIKDLNIIFNEIKRVHKLPKKYFKYFKKINFHRSNIFLSTLDKKYKDKYLSLVKKYKNEKMCVSKIDNAGSNVLKTFDNKYLFIDNEWVQLANDYWDYAENIRWILDFGWEKINFSKYIKNFSMKKLRDFIFMSCVYNYLWTFRMDPHPTTAYYRRYLIKSIRKSFKDLK